MARWTALQAGLVAHHGACQLCGSEGELSLYAKVVVVCPKCHAYLKQAAPALAAEKPQRRVLERRIAVLEAAISSQDWMIVELLRMAGKAKRTGD